jgi:hypothetical protein
MHPTNLVSTQDLRLCNRHLRLPQSLHPRGVQDPLRRRNAGQDRPGVGRGESNVDNEYSIGRVDLLRGGICIATHKCNKGSPPSLTS